jgi:hypothetical protein
MPGVALEEAQRAATEMQVGAILLGTLQEMEGSGHIGVLLAPGVLAALVGLHEYVHGISRGCKVGGEAYRWLGCCSLISLVRACMGSLPYAA